MLIHPFRRLISLIVTIAFLSTQCGTGTALALRPTSEGNSAQAVGDALKARGAAAAGDELFTLPEDVAREIVDTVLRIRDTLPLDNNFNLFLSRKAEF